MSTPFKVQAQAKAKGEKLKAGRKDAEGKKKPRKGGAAAASAAAPGKTKGGAAPVEPAEKVVYEPEPAGEDDHAFFDDEDNADYAKFMLSLDSSGLTTFSKRAKDRVAVPPTSKKKKSKKPLGGPTSGAAGAGDTEEAAPRDPKSTPAAAAAVLDDESPAPATAKALPTTSTPAAVKRGKKEAVVDAKRRNASTAGWAVTDSGPERLPIKTRRGLLKPNERMQQQQQQQQQQEEEEEEPAEAAVPGKHRAGGDTKAVNGSATTGQGADKKAAVERGGDTTGGSEQENGEGGGGDDMMSIDDESFYDSADDSQVEDYTMDELDAGGGGGDGGSGVANGRTGGRGDASKVDLAVLRRRRFEQKKALMGELCESILGAPEESLVRPKTVAKGEDERSRMEQLSALVSLLAATRCACVGCDEIHASVAVTAGRLMEDVRKDYLRMSLSRLFSSRGFRTGGISND